jgi:molybdopterin adenylyltransferase
MSNPIEVVSVNVSEKKGTPKKPVVEILLNDLGVEGDAHAGPWHRQVSLLSHESIERFAAHAGRSFSPGDFAENVTVHGIDLAHVALLDLFRIGDSAELEVTQIGKECHGDGCAIFQEVGRCAMPKEGVFCRVLRGGSVRPGDPVEFLPKTLRIHIVTLSDRAFRGEYEDNSGPRAKELLEAFFSADRRDARPPQITAAILPDDADLLRENLRSACQSGVDVIITTGGTGVGPRDCAPETVASLCDKIIPGIMDHIRLKFGAHNPNALLSRSIAGVAGETLIYALPGSPRAVEEYLGEILQTLEHLIYMVHGLDAHKIHE